MGSRKKMQQAKRNFVADPSLQLLLMTHTGPHKSATTVFSVNGTHVIYGGSAHQTDALMENFAHDNVNSSDVRRILLANMHGHIHPAKGMDTSFPNDIRIINPGPLFKGFYGEMSL